MALSIPPSNILLIRYFTTYMLYDIFLICIKRKGKLQCSVVPDAVMSGFPAIPTKNQGFAPILNATVLTGRNLAKESKRGWSKRLGVMAMSVGYGRLP
jgi:hypothetical protein